MTVQPVSISGGYLTFPFDVDPDQLTADAIDYIVAQIPNYNPAEPHLGIWLIEAVATMLSQVMQAVADVPPSIFTYFGQQLLQLPPELGAAATIPTSWTMIDANGYTIPAGTVVNYPTSVSDGVLFALMSDLVIPNGSSTRTAVLAAVSIGAAGNNLNPATMVLAEPVSYVQTITSTALSTGGADPEDPVAYLDRLSKLLQLLTPRPILPADFSALALNVAGVARAVTIDGYNPADSSTGNERMVTVVGVDSSGNALSTPLTTTMQAYLDGLREVNFVVNTMAPTFTQIDVTAHLQAKPGQDTDALTTAATAAVSNYLQPYLWGGGDETPPTWRNETTVRYLEVVAVLGGIDGVDYPVSVSIGVHGGSLATSDVALGTPVGLPRVGTVSVTVT